MLVFTTKIPLKADTTQKQCVELFIKWVSDAYQYPFAYHDFAEYDCEGHQDLTMLCTHLMEKR